MEEAVVEEAVVGEAVVEEAVVAVVRTPCPWGPYSRCYDFFLLLQLLLLQLRVLLKLPTPLGELQLPEVWSAGVCALELLMGQNPFMGGNMEELHSGSWDAPKEVLGDLNRGFPLGSVGT